MSWQAVQWVLEHSSSKGAARLVLLSIASHADLNGEQSWPSVKTIAREARVSRRMVFYCLERLVKLGDLQRVAGSGRGKTSAYRLRLVSPQPMLPLERVQGLHPNRLEPSTSTTSGSGDHGPPLAYDGQHLKITAAHDARLQAAYPDLNVALYYPEMDLYLDTHRDDPKGRRKNHYAFARNWLTRERRAACNERGGTSGQRNGRSTGKSRDQERRQTTAAALNRVFGLG